MKSLAWLGFALWACNVAVIGCQARAKPANSTLATTRALSALETKLAERISIGGLNLDSLDRILPCVVGEVRYEIDRDAFARRGIDLSARQMVHPPAEAVPRRQLLKDILDQVPATYLLEGEAIRIVPTS